jgi:thioredoxin-like negative regulator of GroEL
VTILDGPAPAAEADEQTSQQPKLVFFYSPRSGKSRRTEGFLAQVLQRRGNHKTFKLLRINADDRLDLVERFRVTEIPSLLVIDDGQVRVRLSAPRGCTDIERMLKPWLK